VKLTGLQPEPRGSSLRLYDTKLVVSTGNQILKSRVGVFVVPEDLLRYVTPDPDTGVPQPASQTLSEAYTDVLEDLMSMLTAWASNLAGVRDDLESELRNAEARRDMLEFMAYEQTVGSIENRKRLARMHPDVQKADFDYRVWDHAKRKAETLADRLDRFVGVLKYAHKRTQERLMRSGTVPGN
jgi:hypothetical protein